MWLSVSLDDVSVNNVWKILLVFNKNSLSWNFKLTSWTQHYIIPTIIIKLLSASHQVFACVDSTKSLKYWFWITQGFSHEYDFPVREREYATQCRLAITWQKEVLRLSRRNYLWDNKGDRLSSFTAAPKLRAGFGFYIRSGQLPGCPIKEERKTLFWQILSHIVRNVSMWVVWYNASFCSDSLELISALSPTWLLGRYVHSKLVSNVTITSSVFRLVSKTLLTITA